MSAPQQEAEQKRAPPLAGERAWSEEDRLAALDAYGIVGSLPETAFDDIARIAARALDAPIAVVGFIDRDANWFKSEIGLGIREVPRNLSFCSHAIKQKGLFVVTDATRDKRFSCNPFVIGEPHVRFYAGAVLLTSAGAPLGTVCVLDHAPRPLGPTQAQSDILSALARSVMRELEVRVERRFLDVALSAMDQGLMMIEADGRVPIVNARAAELLGLPDDFLKSQPRFDELVGRLALSGEFDRMPEELRRDIERGAVHATRFNYERSRPNGTVLEVRTVPIAGGGVVRTFTDITARKAAEEEIWRMANQDPLTGLPNRAAFAKRLNEALEKAEAEGTTVSLFLVDLDEFKDVNDLLGHDAGDELLRQTAQRLTAMTRGSDMVARLGGDEFAVIVTEPMTLAEAALFAERLAEKLRATFHFHGRTLSTRASIGVAAYPDHHRDAVELMKDADIALYRAKADGRTRAVVYDERARKAMHQRVRIAQEVRTGLARDEFAPFYQPKIDLRSGRIRGFEALARWRSPAGGLLTPAHFGSAFVDFDIALAFGRMMIDKVATDMRRWIDGGLDFGAVAVNVSSAEFADPNLADGFLEILARHGARAERLEIELTETVFLGRDPETIAATLQRFHDDGVRIALDDFGTGFASLMHLKQFCVDHLKIDQSFVRNFRVDTGDAAIVEAVIGLGRSFGLEVTAEGVETVEQAEGLRILGCDYAQGFLYAKPMPASRVPWFIENWNGPAARHAFDAPPSAEAHGPSADAA